MNTKIDKKPQENKKIFIGGLPKDLTMEEYRSYFEKYGELADIAIICDKKTKEPRGRFGSTGFGFVSYKDSSAVDAVLKDYDKHCFGDKWVECKLSYPKEQGGSSDADQKRKPAAKSNKQDSSPFHSNDDPMHGNQEADHYGMYPGSSKTPSYTKGQSDYPGKRVGLGPPPGLYGQTHYPDYYYYPPAYHYPYHGAPMMGYQQGPPGHSYQMAHGHGRQPPMGHPMQADVYRNLNNEIPHQTLNAKMKSGSHAVGSSCHSDLHMVANSEELMRRFPPSRGYSNYMNDFGQPKPQQSIVPPKRVLNRIGTFDFDYQKEESPPANNQDGRPKYNQARYMFQNMKSTSLHPEDFQRLEYRAAHLSPSRIKISPNTDLTPMNKFGLLAASGPYDPPAQKFPAKVVKQEFEIKKKNEPSDE